MDAGYNYGIRHAFVTPVLLGNPSPRRFACFIVAHMLTGRGLGFAYGLPILGLVLGVHWLPF